MHHVTLDSWSRGESFLHSRDPRVKLLALLVFLAVLSTTPPGGSYFLFLLQMTAYFCLLLSAIGAARLPVLALEKRALVVLPFSLTFGAVSWLAGDPLQAVVLITKSYLSALAAVLVTATTPMPVLLTGLESLGAPRLFVLVVQFLHRYLFVVSEQAQHMRSAAACRRGLNRNSWRGRFEAAGGTVSVLFARSHARASAIHSAMLARGFEGRFPIDRGRRVGAADGLFLAASVLAPVAVRLAFRPQ